MASPPGKPGHRLTRDSTDCDRESADVEHNGNDGYRLHETPKEAAQAIADALDFLEKETAKLGVRGARELIQRASATMREFAKRAPEADG